MGGSEKKRAGFRERVNKLHLGFKVLAAAMLLFVLYTGLGFLAAPPVIKSRLVSTLQERLGRDVFVERVSFNPLNLKLDVQGLSISRLEGEGSFATLDALQIDLEYFSLVEWALVLKEARLIRPDVRVVYREDGSYNISGLLSEKEQAPQPDAPSRLFPVVLKSFAIEGGSFVLEDRSVGKTHSVQDVKLVLPFASTLPEDFGEPLVPELSAVVNDTPVSLTGRALPFADPLRAEFEFTIQGSDLTHYWDYAPMPQKAGLKKGLLSCDAAFVFEQGRGVLPKLYVRGDFRLEDVVMTGLGGGEVLRFDKLELKLKDVGIFDRVIRAESLQVTAPYASLTRTEDGGFDWTGYLPLTGKGAESAGQPEEKADSESKGPDGGEAARPAFQLEADLLQVTGGRFDFADNTVPGGFTYSLAPIEVTAQGVDTTDEEPARLTATIGDAASGEVTVNAEFGLFPLQAQGRVELSGFNSVDFKAYYKETLPLDVIAGVLGASAEVTVPPGRVAATRVHDASIALVDLALALPGAEAPQIQVPRLAVQGGVADPSERRVNVQSVRVEGAVLELTRAKDGAVDFLGALGRQGRDEKETGEQSGKPWDLAVDAFELSGASVSWTDDAAPRGARIKIEDVSASLAGFRLGEGVEMPLAASARLAGGGGLSFDGVLELPSRVSGEVQVDALSLKPVNGYLPAASALDVADGTLSMQGSLAVDGDRALRFKGNGGISGLALKDDGSGEKVFALAGLQLADVQVEGVPYVVRVGDVALSGAEAFFSVYEDGASNVGNVLVGFTGQAGGSGGGQDNGEKQGGGLAGLAVGRVRLENGRLRYKDQRVTPSFQSELDSLNAEISGLAIPSSQASTISISGLIDGSAPVSAQGSMNIAEASAQTDLVLSVENMALPSLTPYSVKYIAYPLTRGKLYADVDMTIRDMLLNAQSVFRIERMEIGKKVDSESAADVPIELAMSLLTDGSGTMVLDVPVSGRLDDPKFSLGKVIFKAVGSLLGNIVTAPFAFIGAIFGGGDDIENAGVLEFRPGSSELDGLGRQKLDTVAKALADRPRLRLELAGYVDPEADARALEDARILALVRKQKHEDMGEQAPQDPAMVQVPEDEYLVYLQAAFAEVVGEDPGARAAEALENELRRYVAAGSDELRALAASRGRAAREYLTKNAGLEPGRIFMVEHDHEAVPDQEGVVRARVALGLSG